MNNNHIKIGIVALLIASCWAYLIFQLAVHTLPHGALTGSRLKSANLGAIMPQGWAFFTRNPREENYFIYQKVEGKYQQVIQSNCSRSNLFGTARKSRVQSVELGDILAKVDGHEWLSCPEGIGQSRAVDTLTEVLVLNRVETPTICGLYYIEKKEPVPWAWGKYYKEIAMPSSVIKIHTICAD